MASGVEFGDSVLVLRKHVDLSIEQIEARIDFAQLRTQLASIATSSIDAASLAHSTVGEQG